MAKRNGTLRARKTLVTEQSRIIKYVPDKVQKKVAQNFGNVETQRDIILAHVESKHPGMTSIFNDNYYREVDEFIEFIENKHVKEVEEAQNKKMGISKPSKKIRVSKKDTKNVIKSKTKDGKVYTRSKTKNFENKKVSVAFIKKRVDEGKSNKQITEDYNKFARNRGWNERTVSSIATLKSRQKLTKK